MSAKTHASDQSSGWIFTWSTNNNEIRFKSVDLLSMLQRMAVKARKISILHISIEMCQLISECNGLMEFIERVFVRSLNILTESWHNFYVTPPPPMFFCLILPPCTKKTCRFIFILKCIVFCVYTKEFVQKQKKTHLETIPKFSPKCWT